MRALAAAISWVAARVPRSSRRGRAPVQAVTHHSSAGNARAQPRGQFSHPVVMQSCEVKGRVWRCAWCAGGRMSWRRCRKARTGGGSDRCAHLWNWLVRSSQATRAPRNAGRKMLPACAGPGASQMARPRTGRPIRQLFAVGLGEVVPGDGQRVLMVLPERPEHCLADERQVRRSPGIRGPVRQARDEVRGQVGQEHRGEHQPGSPGQVGQQAQGEPAGQGGPGEEAGPVEPADGPVALGGLSAGTLVLAARHLDSSRLDLTRRPDEREAYRSGPSRVCPCTGGASPRIRPGWV